MEVPQYYSEAETALYNDIARMGQNKPVEQVIAVRRRANQAFGVYTESGYDKMLWDLIGDPRKIDTPHNPITFPEVGEIDFDQRLFSGYTPKGGILHIGISSQDKVRGTNESYAVYSMQLETGLTEWWRVIDVKRNILAPGYKPIFETTLYLTDSAVPLASEIADTFMHTGDPVEDAIMTKYALLRQIKARESLATAVFQESEESRPTSVKFAGRDQRTEIFRPLWHLAMSLEKLKQTYGEEKLYGVPVRHGELITADTMSG